MLSPKVLLLLLLPIMPALLLVASLAHDIGQDQNDPIGLFLAVGAGLVAILALLVRFNLFPQ